jgi:glyoxylase-like metal-dependent hydrolase (beta-lactamase superfamily II)
MMKSMRSFSVIGLGTVALGAAATLCAQQIRVVPVQRNVYVLSSAGNNITVQTGREGILLVDTESAPLAEKTLEEIRRLSQRHVRFIVNTSARDEHAGGNGALASLIPADGQDPLNIIAHTNVLNRLAAADAEHPKGKNLNEPGLPVDEYDLPSKKIHFNDEAIILYHELNAITDGDTIVQFRGSDAISTGDIFTPERYPEIDMKNGGTAQGELAALNHLLELAVPGAQQEGGTYLIPGHGRICDDADLVEYRDMVAIVIDRVQDLIKKGKNLEQVKAAKPTEDYDTQFGAGAKFIEAVYKSLGGK